MNVSGRDANLLDTIPAIKDSIAKLKSETVTVLGTTTELTSVPASFLDLAAVQTYLATVVPQTESRLDSIETKLDVLINALKNSEVVL